MAATIPAEGAIILERAASRPVRPAQTREQSKARRGVVLLRSVCRAAGYASLRNLPCPASGESLIILARAHALFLWLDSLVKSGTMGVKVFYIG